MTGRAPGGPLRVGLTGGIASGKSSVSAELARRGYPLLDADEVYHRLVADDGELRAALAEAFGAGVFAPDGSLDRKALGARVFTDPAARTRLGEITHPRVRREMVGWIEARTRDVPAAPGVFVAIPLLFENGLEVLFDRTVLVSCPPEEQLRRLVADRGLTRDEAERRLAAQMPLAEKRRRAGLELVNDGPRAELPARVATLLRDLGLPEVYPPPRA